MFEEPAASPVPGPRPPLAARMRPRTLDEYLGQERILGKGTLLRRAIETDRLFSSIILWGPPGTGKTTLASLVAASTQARFATLSAVMAGVKDLREVVAEAQKWRDKGQRTLLLVDEIHRFNKSQQDALLPHVEQGTVLLIGATTENPYFEVNRALLSRSRIFQLKGLEPADLKTMLERALADPERGYGKLEVAQEPQVLDYLVEIAGGDARAALNALELAVESAPYDAQGRVKLTLAVAQEAAQKKAIHYDKGSDLHYDTISAFIKSVRGSDPDASLFYLGRMLEGGEDARFIMRRLLILAGEDIGLADPRAITVVASCSQALEWVGLPEAKYHLAMATVYLACAPKSNSLTGYFAAEKAAADHPTALVPAPLRDGHYAGAAQLGHGKGYRYPHDFPGNHVAQQYLPEELAGARFYEPGDQGYEPILAERLRRWRGEENPTR